MTVLIEPIVPNNANTPKPHIKLCTFNIWSGGGSRLTFALKTLQLMKIDVAVLTETKLAVNTYTREAYGYTVYATDEQNNHKGGVALVIRESNKFVIEGVEKYGTNVIRAVLVSGKTKWLLLGCYVPPSDKDGNTINQLQLATHDYHKFDNIILLGDLNTNLNNMMHTTVRQEEVAAAISLLGLKDLQNHFRLRQNRRWTWRQFREGRRITGICDYILTTSIHGFKYLKIKAPLHFDTDHRMVLTLLELEDKEEHKQYIQSRTRYPFPVDKDSTNPSDILFQEILDNKEPTKRIQEKKFEDWISPQSHDLFRQKAKARRYNHTHQLKPLRKLLRQSL